MDMPVITMISSMAAWLLRITWTSDKWEGQGNHGQLLNKVGLFAVEELPLQMVQALVLAAASCEISVAVVGIDNRACAVPVTSWD